MLAAQHDISLVWGTSGTEWKTDFMGYLLFSFARSLPPTLARWHLNVPWVLKI